jgi:sulfur relay (sulfurtransferase) complex TusBCD TusD component (DsrE family)
MSEQFEGAALGGGGAMHTVAVVSPSFRRHLLAPPPDIIHHYTTQCGLLGIIEKKELWATKIHYMNDSTEFSVVFQMADEVLKNEESNAPDLSRRKQLANLMRTVTRANREVNVCVVCFCKEWNLLSQWRAYSGGGYGYSIGFETKKLNSLASSSNFILGSCIYDKTYQQSIVKEICDRFLGGSITDTDALISDFTDSIIELGAFFKSESFSEEAEWRLVSKPINARALHFRPGKSMIIPYWKLGLHDSSVIEGVTIGPCPHMRLSLNAVFSLLLKENIGKPTGSPPTVLPVVRCSPIPYRDW